MKVSVNWLKDYVDVDIEAAELAHRLTMSGNEVEGVEVIGMNNHLEVWQRSRINQILEENPLSDEDFLRIAELQPKENRE